MLLRCETAPTSAASVERYSESLAPLVGIESLTGFELETNGVLRTILGLKAAGGVRSPAVVENSF